MTSLLVILPILLPVTAAALLLLVGQRRRLEAALAVTASAGLFGLAITLVLAADGAAFTAIYRLGDWPAPLAIVLVADRLSALMVLLAGPRWGL